MALQHLPAVAGRPHRALGRGAFLKAACLLCSPSYTQQPAGALAFTLPPLFISMIQHQNSLSSQNASGVCALWAQLQRLHLCAPGVPQEGQRWG